MCVTTAWSARLISGAALLSKSKALFNKIQMKYHYNHHGGMQADMVLEKLICRQQEVDYLTEHGLSIFETSKPATVTLPQIKPHLLKLPLPMKAIFLQTTIIPSLFNSLTGEQASK